MSHEVVDEFTIKAAQSGDSSAFERLLELIYDLIFNFAFKWTGNRSDAEDVTQLVCIKLARVIRQFRFESAFKSWVYRIVINCAKDWWRSEKRNAHESITECDVANPDSHDRSGFSQIELQQTLNNIDRMGAGYKETVLLVHGEGLTHAQAATVLQIKESTVSWRLHDIRKRLSMASSEYPKNIESAEKNREELS